MNFFKITLFSALLLFSTQTFAQTTNNMANQKDSLSYSLGILLGDNLKRQGFDDLNSTVLGQAIRDILAGKANITTAQANQNVQQIMQARNASKYEKTIAEGKTFLAENKKRAGVVTLPSGLQYEILKEGNGPKPTAANKVLCHYHGTLLNGKVFDSSVNRGEPITFPVTGVIKGWVEALQLMPVGSKWKLFVPYNLAYGDKGAGSAIGPYSTLIFEVELLEIQ